MSLRAGLARPPHRAKATGHRARPTARPVAAWFLRGPGGTFIKKAPQKKPPRRTAPKPPGAGPAPSPRRARHGFCGGLGGLLSKRPPRKRPPVRSTKKQGQPKASPVSFSFPNSPSASALPGRGWPGPGDPGFCSPCRSKCPPGSSSTRPHGPRCSPGRCPQSPAGPAAPR